MSSQTQQNLVLNRLNKGLGISKLLATHYWSITNLGDVIFVLRRKGYNILKEWRHNPKTGSRYAWCYLGVKK